MGTRAPFPAVFTADLLPLLKHYLSSVDVLSLRLVCSDVRAAVDANQCELAFTDDQFRYRDELYKEMVNVDGRLSFVNGMLARGCRPRSAEVVVMHGNAEERLNLAERVLSAYAASAARDGKPLPTTKLIAGASILTAPIARTLAATFPHLTKLYIMCSPGQHQPGEATDGLQVLLGPAIGVASDGASPAPLLLPKLERLTLGGDPDTAVRVSALPASVISVLQAATHIRQLTICFGRHTKIRRDFPQLARLTHLTSLKLRTLVGLRPGPLDVVLSTCQHLTNLVRLTLDGLAHRPNSGNSDDPPPPLSPASFASLPRLQHLTLRLGELQVEGLERLTSLTRLDVMKLAFPQPPQSWDRYGPYPKESPLVPGRWPLPPRLCVLDIGYNPHFEALASLKAPDSLVLVQPDEPGGFHLQLGYASALPRAEGAWGVAPRLKPGSEAALSHALAFLTGRARCPLKIGGLSDGLGRGSGPRGIAAADAPGTAAGNADGEDAAAMGPESVERAGLAPAAGGGGGGGGGLRGHSRWLSLLGAMHLPELELEDLVLSRQDVETLVQVLGDVTLLRLTHCRFPPACLPELARLPRLRQLSLICPAWDTADNNYATECRMVLETHRKMREEVADLGRSLALQDRTNAPMLALLIPGPASKAKAPPNVNEAAVRAWADGALLPLLRAVGPSRRFLLVVRDSTYGREPAGARLRATVERLRVLLRAEGLLERHRVVLAETWESEALEGLDNSDGSGSGGGIDGDDNSGGDSGTESESDGGAGQGPAAEAPVGAGPSQRGGLGAWGPWGPPLPFAGPGPGLPRPGWAPISPQERILMAQLAHEQTQVVTALLRGGPGPEAGPRMHMQPTAAQSGLGPQAGAGLGPMGPQGGAGLGPMGPPWAGPGPGLIPPGMAPGMGPQAGLGVGPMGPPWAGSGAGMGAQAVWGMGPQAGMGLGQQVGAGMGPPMVPAWAGPGAGMGPMMPPWAGPGMMPPWVGPQLGPLAGAGVGLGPMLPPRAGPGVGPQAGAGVGLGPMMPPRVGPPTGARLQAEPRSSSDDEKELSESEGEGDSGSEGEGETGSEEEGSGASDMEDGAEGQGAWQGPQDGAESDESEHWASDDYI
ncbi:hypothetical protein HYH03_005195 [Edaphochlamys debaryana]|uniref:F-box domain-containing protein n=1 Tax=Edaphochlamys debaryana TaxID=47281 RepID=A0A835Y5M1_9CHLO|nr:hypothetical protein HYH03_005195 [Edaphochlamys debaryana]|eukprot:KAG2496787.1 hypothetical protein HYH03_005195 [Edaphochlamys debaryana]